MVPRGYADTKRVPVTIEGGRSKERLTLLWAGEGWPSDVDAVLTDAPDPWRRELVVVARQFSPGALRRLLERDANWLDEAGDARIIGPSGLFVLRLQKRSVAGRTSVEEGPTWSASALAVGEAILARPNAPILNRELLELTEFSPPQVSRTLAQFDKRGWTRKAGSERGRGALRILEDGDGLLRSWSTHIASEPRKVVEAHALFKDPFTFLSRDLAPDLADFGEWALSGWAGLELEAPFATQVPTLHVYIAESMFVDARIEKLLARARLRRVDEGGRVIFWPASKTALRLKRTSQRRRFPVVSPPRLYADLLSFGGRGIDAAEHVREEIVEL